MKGLARLVIVAVILGLLVPPAAVVSQEQTPYRIGPDDVLTISVWDNKELDQVVFVRPDGKVSLPLAGEIQAGGLTVAELTSQLRDIYGKYVQGAQVTVGVREIRSRPIFFVGGIGRVAAGPAGGPGGTPSSSVAGTMQLTQGLRLLQAISLAGGLVPGADLESSFVLRGDTRIPIDFVKLIQRGDLSQNIKLEPGDTIVVPVADGVYVQGEVRTPGIVRFSKDLTIVRAIAQAGGFTPLAAPSRVIVLRSDGSKRENIKVDVADLMDKPQAKEDLPLRPNDIVIIPQRLF
jgi:polysaccharide export outer membrane protein